MDRSALAALGLTALAATASSSLQAQSPRASPSDPVVIATGAALYRERCAECHGADATGVIGPDLTSLFLSSGSEERVFRTVRLGVSGSVMPPTTGPDDEIWAIVAYLKNLGAVEADESAGGDAVRGEEIFGSTCVQCHRLNDDGGRLGPDLSRIGETRSRASLRRSIREPSRVVAASYRAVSLVTLDGRRVIGIRRNEDAFSIQILDTRERLQGYAKADLKEVIRDKRSLMPDYGPERLSEQDLEDLLQFLGTLRRLMPDTHVC